LLSISADKRIRINRGAGEPDQRLAASMDLVGWRRFMERMISKEVIAIQRRVLVDAEVSFSPGDLTSSGPVTILLETTHEQQLYRNVHVHDLVVGDLALKRKEEIGCCWWDRTGGG
jgi:hypothetical protein